MAQMIVIVGTVSLLAAIIGATIALKNQYNYLNRTQEQLLAWERAQESRQRQWETEQEKRIAELRYDLTELVGKVQYDWEAWQLKDKVRIEQFNKQFEETEAQMHLKREIARLPRVEDALLILDFLFPSIPFTQCKNHENIFLYVRPHRRLSRWR